MKAILDFISIAAVCFAHLAAGPAVTGIGRMHARLFASAGIDEMDLPMLTRWMIRYTATGTPVILGIILGLVSLLGLVHINRSEKHRWLMPFFLTVSFVAVILHLIAVCQGVALPLSRVTYSMGNS
jgi:hypothetical protein